MAALFISIICFYVLVFDITIQEINILIATFMVEICMNYRGILYAEEYIFDLVWAMKSCSPELESCNERVVIWRSWQK